MLNAVYRTVKGCGKDDRFSPIYIIHLIAYKINRFNKIFLNLKRTKLAACRNSLLLNVLLLCHSASATIVDY